MIAVLGCSLFSSSAATNYYVDFVGGSDSANGTSTSTPFQHSPYDANASGMAAGVSLGAGDTVNFKGGVIYSAVGIGGQPFQTSGTSGLPITFQSGDLIGWGTGRAILDGTASGTNYGTAFVLGNYAGANYVTISGLEIRNCVNAVLDWGSYLTLTNCLIHHIGYFPFTYNPTNLIYEDGGQGYGLALRFCAGVVCVSNTMFDINECAVTPVTSVTNLIIWGNDFSNIQDHAFIGSVGDYIVIACNQIHDQTNAVTHDDNLHVMGYRTAIICNNKLWNGNQDTFFNPMAPQGTAYYFNNIILNAADSGMTGGNGSYNGVICQANWAYPATNFYVFNNDFVLKNSGSSAFRVNDDAATNNPIQSILFENNLLFQSRTYSGLNFGTNLVRQITAGYNLYTNAYFGLGNNSSPSPNEIGSRYDAVTFANYQATPGNMAGSDWHLAAGSAGIGQGTNLSTAFPASTFNFLPARYAPDPTKDAAGNSRGSRWDIGALAYPGGVASSDPPAAPTSLTVFGM